VEPGYPAALAPVADAPGSPRDTPSPPNRLTRLDLARWLVSSENPLTARVTVNREWQKFFGRGLVETENDFGIQGSLPTHPELLDWLAVEFREPTVRANPDRQGGGGVHPVADAPGSPKPWSLKSLHRLIMTSATYRQSSAARKDLAEKDPRNLLLGRQTRLRLEAEVIRDAA